MTTLPLDPLSDEVMGELLDGLVRGLPASARSRIVERAEGIPLYAIETVRGLLDKGALETTTTACCILSASSASSRSRLG